MLYTDIDPLSWESVRAAFDELAAEPLTGGNVEPWLQRWSDLASVLYESQAAIYRRVTENTQDSEADRQFTLLVDEILPRAKQAEQGLRDKLLAVEDYRPSRVNEALMRRFRGEAKLFHPANVPIQSELMKLENRYDKMIGGLTVDWDGEPLTIQQAEARLYDRDRAVRERAWHGTIGSYLGVHDELCDLYIEMLRLRRQLPANAGLPDFRAYRWEQLARFDYSPEECYAFHDAIEHEVVPVATRLYQQKAQALGVPTLRPWDATADPAGEPLHPFTDPQELESGVARIFHQVDPELAKHFESMRDGWLDLASRPNKAPGGYCESFPVSGKPYIFMNAVGLHKDVGTLLHEGGHSFHFMESRCQPLFWNQNASNEFCEVASMSMELLAAPYLEKSRGGFYDEKDARRAYADDLRTTVCFLPYMAVVDAFQNWVYTAAPPDVTPDDLNAKWAELWDRFLPGQDFSGLEADKVTGWNRKPHIFQAPFYYIEYGLAQVGALQIWGNALRDQAAAVRSYRQALKLGYTRTLPQLFTAAGASFTFDRPMLRSVMGLIEEQLDRLSA